MATNKFTAEQVSDANGNPTYAHLRIKDVEELLSNTKYIKSHFPKRGDLLCLAHSHRLLTVARPSQSSASRQSSRDTAPSRDTDASTEALSRQFKKSAVITSKGEKSSDTKKCASKADLLVVCATVGLKPKSADSAKAIEAALIKFGVNVQYTGRGTKL